ncbi:MAG: response regulator [Leptolyngbyaceae bacterium]|nr:response regulator [Leptolyngbyaceae bacterium]
MNFQANILLVDDNPDNLRLLGKMLETQHYQVRRTVSGDAALRASQVQPPDLILLDINMPQMSGYEVCQRLKSHEQTAHIPIIFISALDLVTDKLKAFEVGGVDYITKPFQEAEVLVRVKNQLTIQEQRHQLLQQNNQLQLEVGRRQQAENELQELNHHLARQVKARTAELELAFEFEATLKRITDQVRDTLDEDKILSTAVYELARTIGVHACNASMYHLSGHTAHIIQEYTTRSGQYHKRLIQMNEFPEIYGPLMNKEPIQFCSLLPNEDRGSVATLACPIFDEQGVIGDIWLANHTYYAFHEQDIRLVQQVANQCAIALRQAKLYQAAQAQVVELERLNRLKDDFVSTVSHELRTPLASIKAVSQLLEANLSRLTQPDVELLSIVPEKVNHYLRVLSEECDREIKLINDLLYLSGIDFDDDVEMNATLNIRRWLPYLAKTFEQRIQSHNCELKIDVPDDVPELTTNISYLERILTELINNACKYTPSGHWIQVSAKVETAWLHFQITNSGVSIAEEEFERVFDKFYRIPRHDPWKYGGTGLGLALIRKLALAMGASIRVTSDEHTTTFTLSVPLIRLGTSQRHSS